MQFSLQVILKEKINYKKLNYSIKMLKKLKFVLETMERDFFSSEETKVGTKMNSENSQNL